MTRALIIGGGIAGPTTAMALQRVGIEAMLYEAHPRTADEVGSYFTVTPNGLDALRAIGALHTATAIGFPTHKNVLWNDRGRRLGDLMLPIVFRFFVTEKSLAWMYNYRVDLDSSVRLEARAA
jgi:2-polyprenyl-6-methoxyphenol hydroxylase-like FAD-dependent oxidoreductase